MYGTNEVASQFNDDGAELLVSEFFYTLQGEGPDAGCPAVFVRLARCNLRCWFCDTDFSREVSYPMGRLVEEVLHLCKQHGCSLVVLTGGEPLLQNVIPFVDALNAKGVHVSVETAGTVFLKELPWVFDADAGSNKIVCSPKTPELNEGIKPYVHSYKYIVQFNAMDEEGLPALSTQIRGKPQRIFRPWPIRRNKRRIYLQPMDVGDIHENYKNLVAASTACLKHGYRLSVQMHKLAGLP